MNPVVMLLSTALTLASAASDQAAAQKCCLKNPGYSGVCEVTIGEGETCRNVLDYLNTANSAGKSYCGNTAIRGGWEPVACEAKK